MMRARYLKMQSAEVFSPEDDEAFTHEWSGSLLDEPRLMENEKVG